MRLLLGKNHLFFPVLVIFIMLLELPDLLRVAGSSGYSQSF